MKITIRLDRFIDGPVAEEQPLTTEWCAERLGAEFKPFDEAFKVHIKGRRAANVVEVDCVITGAYGLGCSKCGEDITLTFETGFTHRFVPPNSLTTPTDDKDDLFADDPDITEHDGAEVDLRPVCIEHVILAVPFAPSCVDRAIGACDKWSDEPTQFGDELPDDPEEESPWAALKNIQLPDGPADS